MASHNVCLTVLRGFNDAYGSWKIICISFLILRISSLDLAITSWPSSPTLPPVGSSRRRMPRPVVDLPQPDSPTTAIVSPLSIEKVMPSTALTWLTVRPRKPPLIGKCCARFSTFNNGCLLGIYLYLLISVPLISINPASDFVAVSLIFKFRQRVANIRCERAAGCKTAAGRHFVRCRYITFNRNQLILRFIVARQ